jgi:DNA repair protein RadC
LGTVYTTYIRDLPVDERPRERLVNYGPQVLSAAELLAVLLRTGTQEFSAIGLAEKLLSHFGSLRALSNATVEQLASFKGIGTAKAAQLQAAIELGKRLAVFGENTKPVIRSPHDVHSLVTPELRDEQKEHFKALMLDTKNQVIRIKTISIGSLNASLIHPRELYREAISAASASVIVVHNHPSGDPTPSREDIEVTKRLMEAGKVVGIDLLDHIVVGDGRWVSLKERGLL